MKDRNIRLTSLFFFATLVILLVSTFLIGFFWISREYSRHKETLNELEDRMMSYEKDIIKYEVQRSVSYVNDLHEKQDEDLKALIKNWTNLAYSISENIYDENSGNLTNEEIEHIIREALRPVRFSNGRGYIFITEMNGTSILFADKPELETHYTKSSEIFNFG